MPAARSSSASVRSARASRPASRPACSAASRRVVAVERLPQGRALPARLDRRGGLWLVGGVDVHAQVRVAHPALGLDELAVEAPALGALAGQLLHLGAQGDRAGARLLERRAAGCLVPEALLCAGGLRVDRRRGEQLAAALLVLVVDLLRLSAAIAIEHQPVSADAARDQGEQQQRDRGRRPERRERRWLRRRRARPSRRARRAGRPRARGQARGARMQALEHVLELAQRGELGAVAVGLVHGRRSPSIARRRASASASAGSTASAARRARSARSDAVARASRALSSSTIADGSIGAASASAARACGRARRASPRASSPARSTARSRRAAGRWRSRASCASRLLGVTGGDGGLARGERRTLDLVARAARRRAAPRRRGAPRRARAEAGACWSGRCRSSRVARRAARRRGSPTRSARCSRAPTRAPRRPRPPRRRWRRARPGARRGCARRPRARCRAVSVRSTPSPTPRIADVRSWPVSASRATNEVRPLRSQSIRSATPRASRVTIETR